MYIIVIGGILLVIFVVIIFVAAIRNIPKEPETYVDAPNTKIETNFNNSNVYIAKSCMGDRGAFASRDIKQGEVVEACPVILEKRENVPQKSRIDDYVFSSGRDGELAIAFGYCSMFNHHPKNNVTWKVEPETQKIVFTAKRDIKKDEELYISYGDTYWQTRKIEAKTCPKNPI
jgi:SET domain-containing protein